MDNIDEIAKKQLAKSKNMTVEELEKYRDYSSRKLSSKEWIEYLKLCEKAFKGTSKYLYIYDYELIEINKEIANLEQQLKKKDEVIDKLIKNENINNFLKDSLKLQIEMNKLFKKHNVTMEDLRNLCIPFRDKYNFTDHQTLRIAREEVTKEELLQILEDKEVE